MALPGCTWGSRAPAIALLGFSKVSLRSQCMLTPSLAWGFDLVVGGFGCRTLCHTCPSSLQPSSQLLPPLKAPSIFPFSPATTVLISSFFLVLYPSSSLSQVQNDKKIIGAETRFPTKEKHGKERDRHLKLCVPSLGEGQQNRE